MRQNPITARLQVGGRSMPSWFSASLVGDGNGNRRGNSGAAPPPPTTAPPSAHNESDYEEIDHLPRYSNTNVKKPTAIKRTCSLCGNGNPVVRCELCNNQIFCGSCNDMYHRHPKRHNHVRKLIEAVETRPPLPPKAMAPPDTPVPPPRRMKKFGMRSATNSPTSFRKVFFDPMGSLKRQFTNGMEQRPLPPPPKPAPPLPPKADSRNMFNDRRHTSQQVLPTAPPQHFQQSPHPNRNIPLTVQEMSNQHSRNDLRHQEMMRGQWDDRNFQDNFDLARPRAQSISTSQLNRFNSSSNISHIATLQRKPKRPIVCGPVRPQPQPPPAIPPREFPPPQQSQHSHPHFNPNPQSLHSASAFNLNQMPMDDPQQFPPWMYPFGYQQQQQMMMFQPGSTSSMRRTPSTSSMTSQPVFNPWSTFQLGHQGQGHAHPLTASERELQMITDRRGSEPPPPLPPYGNQIRPNSAFQQQAPMSRGRVEPEHAQFQSDPDRSVSPFLVQHRRKDSFSRADSRRGSNQPPEGYWQCEWCTLINVNDSKICSACCKTPSSSVNVADAEAQNSSASNVSSSKGKRGKSPAPKKPSFVRSTLSFRNEKDKTSARVEKQIMKLEISDEDLAGDSTSEEEEVPRRETFRSVPNKRVAGKAAKTPLTSSNEEVYGSIPLQSLALAPRGKEPTPAKEAKEPVKISTGVGSSPPRSSFLETKTGSTSAQEDSSVSSHGSKGIKPALKKTTETSTSSSFTDERPIQKVVTASSQRSSIGTSPPPQSISTQTYEELMPSSRLESKSTSKSSIAAAMELLDEPVRKAKEMSDKELRYSRKAQQQSKLKRSMSTHLTSQADPWVDANEGRHLYRSSSRHSLASDTRSLPLSGPPSRDASPPRGRLYQDFRAFEPPSWDRFPSPADYFASIEDLVNRRRKDSARNQEFELTRLLKEAVELGYAPEDVQVALRMCGERNPIKWLQDNWGNMVETVQTLASKYGVEKGEDKNEVGTISSQEAKEALRQHRGNVWVAVTECVDQRRKKFLELQSRGNFLREDILTALTANHGKLDAAYVELSKAQLKPFLMQIWGPPIGLDNEAAPPSSRSNADSSSPPAIMCSQKLYEDVLTIDEIEDKKAIENVPAENQLDASVTEQDNLNVQEDPPEVVKRASIEEDPFLDADEEALLEENLKEVEIGNFSDLEESEAFVSDLLQNYEDLPSATPQSSTAQSPLLSPLGNDSNAKANPTQPTPALTEHGQTAVQAEINVNPGVGEVQSSQQQQQQQTLTPSNMHLLSEALKVSNESADGVVSSKISFSMEAVLELLEQQRLKMMKSQGEPQVVSNNSSVPQAGTSSQIQTEVQEAIIPAPTSTTLPSLAQALEEVKPDLAVKVKLEAVLVEAEDFDDNEELIEANASARSEAGASNVPARAEVARNNQHILQQQQSVDSGDMEMDPSIYEEVDSGENFSITEYLTKGNSYEEETDPEGSSSGEEDSEEGSDDDSIGTHSDELEEELVEDFYEKIEPMVDPKSISIAHAMNEPIQDPATIENPKEIAAAIVGAAIQDLVKKEDIYKNVKPEVKRLIETGLSDSFENAELAVQLMDMKFNEEDSIHAAKECGSLYSALSYLQQECLLCAGKFSAMQMISMLSCKHWCCKTCAREYFQVQVRDHGILDATCPFCKEPSNLLEDPDAAADYFNNLDIMLKNILDDKHHELFQRKLRDWTLSNMPNFKWCSKCSSGFITEPLQTRLVCPDCSAVTCAVCLEPWDRTHDHRDQNVVKLCDTDATKNIVDYLNENCIECPRCRLKFALARGGCMHLTCSQCKFEFCSGCSAPFRLANKCNDGPFCLKLGLHAHHPRNCLFYLRDKDAPILAKLLEENAIPYLSEEVVPEGKTEVRKCKVSIQRETDTGLLDDVCGNDAPSGFATVCEAHYIEYLGLLIWQNRLDPISILSNDDLETIIKRAHKKVPSKIYGTKDADFRIKLLKVINDDIPL